MDGKTEQRRGLTGAQRRASDPKQSVWVSASAGTGKTKVLADRVLNLLLAGTPPSRILCLTFTKAAAAVMNDRMARILGRWSIADDKALRNELRQLAVTAPDDTMLRTARRLFAAVLDEPGGMKIMTIHAFCQSVLKRFPVEAGLAPHFTVMDERDTAELMDEARKELFFRARQRDDPLFEAFSCVANFINEDEFAALMQELAADRSRLQGVLVGGGGDIGTLRKRLGLGARDDERTVRAAACQNAMLDESGLRTAAVAMIAGSATDRRHGQVIADWLAVSPEKRAHGFHDYLGVYFKDKGRGERRVRLIFSEALKIAPNAEMVLDAEARRLDGVRARLRAAVTATATHAVLRLGEVLLGGYERQKAARALLDYDDLILRTRDLLGRASAAWVLYKLDGGLDHILIDEAQDTNPEQWEVVRLLAEEFFAGEGASGTDRTIFAVGDPKQSIYSFQRAAPQEFERMRAYFSERVEAAGARWRGDVQLEASFRSTQAVLNLVDHVFSREPARTGVVPDDKPLRHLVERTGEAGLVELWPLVPIQEQDVSEEWSPPVEQRRDDSPRARLAGFIAARVHDWIDSGERLESEDRPITPGDVMVLVPRRGPFVEELVWALKSLGVPVAGADRMVLTEQLAVMDLIALGRFLLLPEDDLSLAEVLKSPLCGLTESQLFTLAHGRKGSLWRALGKRREEHADFSRVTTELEGLLSRVDFVPPYELYADLLAAGGGRRRLLARLGREAEDPIDEFLSLCLTYERTHTPSLQGFLHWVEAGRTEVKRDLEQAERDEVRVLTVHGAKGLEAPIVFLPDTMRMPTGQRQGRSALVWPEENDLVLWPPRKQHEETMAREARSRASTLRDQEYRRLLYVALTRAKERLYVCGWQGRHNPQSDSWYNLVAAAMPAAAVKLDDMLAHHSLGWPGSGWRLHVAQSAQLQKAPRTETRAPPPPPPEWLRAPAPVEPVPPRPLMPSRPEEAEPPVRAPIEPSGAAGWADSRFRRGNLIHKMLQVLPQIPADDRAARCRAFLALAAPDLHDRARAAIAGEVMAVLEHPDFAPYFGPESRAEVPLAGAVGNMVVSGQVDRLLIEVNAVKVLDYKSNRPPPEREEGVSAAYLGQMAAYRALLRLIYPGRPVFCALLWTDGPRLMPLSDHLLDRHAP